MWKELVQMHLCNKLILENEATSYMCQGLACFGFSFKYARKKKNCQVASHQQNINAAFARTDHTETAKRMENHAVKCYFVIVTLKQ